MTYHTAQCLHISITLKDSHSRNVPKIKTMKIKIKNVRLSFNDLFTPKAFQGGEAKYSGTFICSDDSTVTVDGVTSPHTKLKEICDNILKVKFGKAPAKVENWLYNKADGSGTRGEFTNEDGEYRAGFTADTWYISASKKESLCRNGEMNVVDQLRSPLTANSGRIHSGVYVNVVIDAYAYESARGGKGITGSLEAVQLLRAGEPMGMTVINAIDDFDDEEVEVDENF